MSGPDSVGRRYAVRVATPLLLVTAVPTDGAVEREADGLARRFRHVVTDDVRVAVNVAVPPTEAVPETLPRVVAAWLTTRSPVAFVAAT